MQSDSMDFGQFSPQMPLPFFDGDTLPDIGLLWADEDLDQLQVPPSVSSTSSATLPAPGEEQTREGGKEIKGRKDTSQPLDTGGKVGASPAPSHGGPHSHPRRHASSTIQSIGKPTPPAGRKCEKRVLGVQKKRGHRTVLVHPPSCKRRGKPSLSSSTATAEEKTSPSKRLHPVGPARPYVCNQLRHGVGEGVPPDIPRMSPACLINRHTQEPDSDVLLDQALQGVSTDLFERSNLQSDDYTNLEEFSVCKLTRPDQPPFVVATSSLEGAQICQDVWSAQHSAHLTKIMVKPPGGPDQPTSSFVAPPEPDALDEVRKKVQAGVRAAPLSCQGLPPQCASWVEAPKVPTPKRRSDFSLLSRNIGAMRRSGYMHVCSSTQLTSINALPGSLSVKYLVLMATLLGQPILGQALGAENLTGDELASPPENYETGFPAPLTGGPANPTPLFSWHPNIDFQHKMIRIDNTDVTFLLGHFPAIQITLPTSRRRLLRVDRIVDLAELSVLQHNAIRWTRLAVNDDSTITTDSFRLIGGAGSSVEYLLHSQHLSASSCSALAKAKHGRLPVSQAEVSFATEAVSATEMIWTDPHQSSAESGASAFSYELHLEDKQLLPLTNNPAPCTVLHMLQGEAHEVSEDEIGSQYTWFIDSGPGAYHVYNPWHLTASLSTNGSCAVYVPHANQARTPASFLNRCLVLRNGSLAAVHRRQLHSAVLLQQDRLSALQGLPSEMRLQNQEHTLGPLNTATIRLIQPLQSGEEKLVLDTTQEALTSETREVPLTLQDFRPLAPANPIDPVPTPSALVAIGSTILSTAGSFVLQSVTQEVLSKAMDRILVGGKYRYLDPMLLQDALASPDRTTYLSTFNTLPNQAYSWDEKQNVLLLRNLKILGHLPEDAAKDQAQLASGLAVVTGAAQALEQFNQRGLRQLEKVALNFLASSDLKIDTHQGGLVYVVRSGSIALISYFLSIVDTSPALQTHRLHPLPAFHGKAKGTSIALDLPPYFTLTHQAVDVNSSAAQSTCARAITSQEYHEAFSKEHPACFTTTTKVPMLTIIYEQDGTRLAQTVSPPGQSMVAFLACASRTAHRFILRSEVNVFLIPGACQMHFTIMNSKLAAVDSTTSNPGNTQFTWLLAYNTSAYGYQLSAQEEVYIALYSTLGAAVLCVLVLAGLAFKYKHLLPWFKAGSSGAPAASVSNTYVGLAPTIFHPHLGPRSLSDFSSSEESVPQAAAHVRPSSLRGRPPFASYTATVRRGEKKKVSTGDQVRSLCPPKDKSAPATEESVL